METTESTEKSDTLLTNLEDSLIIDIDNIKSCAEHGFTNLNLANANNTKGELSVDFINNKLGHILVNNSVDWNLKAYEFEKFRCHEWEENDEYFLFTMLQQDESCCLSMYICSTDKKGTPLAIQFLGLVGGDGGWNETDSIATKDFGAFTVFKNSEYDEDVFSETGEDLGYTREFDHYRVDVSFNQGSFKSDTVSHIESDTLIK